MAKAWPRPDLLDQAKAVIEAMKARGAAVPIPTDVVTAKTFSADAKAEIKAATDVADDDMILDIGPETAKALAAQLMKAGTIVWNGPVGVFEFAAFENGTKTIAKAIAESSAFSIAGGGDTLAAIAKYGIESKWATSAPVGRFWRCWRARRCRRLRFCRSVQTPDCRTNASGANAAPRIKLHIVRKLRGLPPVSSDWIVCIA